MRGEVGGMVDEGGAIEPVSVIVFVVRVFFGAYSGGSHRSLQWGLERTSPTLEPKSLPTGEILSIVRETGGSDVFHRSET